MYLDKQDPVLKIRKCWEETNTSIVPLSRLSFCHDDFWTMSTMIMSQRVIIKASGWVSQLSYDWPAQKNYRRLLYCFKSDLPEAERSSELLGTTHVS